MATDAERLEGLDILKFVSIISVIITHYSFSILNKHFSKYNNIQCESSSIPYLYPLFLTCDIRKELIQKKIYVPTLWGQCLNQNNLFEKELTEKTIFIPLDQRYDKMDINYIVSVINSLL